MDPAANAWFSVRGELNDWRPGLFRALAHRVRPDARILAVDGRRYFVAICGSVVVAGTAHCERFSQCSDCLQLP